MPTIGERQKGVIQRGLAGGDANRSRAAFERGDPTLEGFDGRVADAAVAETIRLEIEKRRAVIGAVEFIGDRLIDWDGDGLGRRVADKPAMDRKCFIAHQEFAKVNAPTRGRPGAARPVPRKRCAPSVKFSTIGTKDRDAELSESSLDCGKSVTIFHFSFPMPPRWTDRS